MHIPNYFKVDNKDVIRSFVKKNSFGIIISHGQPGLAGTHIPLEWEESPLGEEVLYGHIAVGNSQRQSLIEGAEVLCIFQGPHTYVSSSWYDHENVPTWNYMAAHIRGNLLALDDQETWYAMKKLVDKYEVGRENRQDMDRYSEKTLRQLKGIFAFKITIEEMACAFKLSQNRNSQDFESIIQQLIGSGDAMSAAVAEEMSKLKDNK